MAKRKLTGRQVRYLFATGKLRSVGSGKNRRVVYNAQGGTAKRSGKGGARRLGKQQPGLKRVVIGGSKAAGLRSGAGAGRKVPSKAERDATRAERIAAGVRKAEQAIGSGPGSSSGALARMLLKENPTRTGARSLRAEVRQESIRAGVERLAADRGATPGEVARAIARAPRGKRREHFLKIQQKGVDGVDMGQRVKLFSSFGKSTPRPAPQSKPDHSATRAARIAAGRKVTERGVLPGGFQEGRLHAAQLARAKRSQAASFDKQAAYYKEQGNQVGVEAQSRYAREKRAEARSIVAIAKQRGPRLTREQARALSQQTKAELQAERQVEKARKKAEKTLASITKAQRFTYNGFKGNPKRRYAALKDRERKLRAKYGL